LAWGAGQRYGMERTFFKPWLGWSVSWRLHGWGGHLMRRSRHVVVLVCTISQ
jgi:hypothetical protein